MASPPHDRIAITTKCEVKLGFDINTMLLFENSKMPLIKKDISSLNNIRINTYGKLNNTIVPLIISNDKPAFLIP